MDNPILYSNFVKPDSSISDLIQQLETLMSLYVNMSKTIKGEASELTKAISKAKNVTDKQRDATVKQAEAADRLTKEWEGLGASAKAVAKQQAELKLEQSKLNNISKLTVKLNQAKKGSYNALSAQYSLNKIKLNEMSAAERSATRSGKRLEEQTKAIYEQMNRLQKATGKSQLQVGRYNMVTNRLNSSLGALAATYLSVAGAQRALTALYDDTKTIDGLDAAYKAVIKDQDELIRTTEFLDRVADNNGQNILTLSKAYLTFAAATKGSRLEGAQTKNMFEAVSKAGALLQLSTADVEGTLRALSQIISKGKVQAEELRGQLGDRLPGALRIMSTALGVSTQEIDKLLKAGQLYADDVLPLFAAEMEKAYGTDQVTRIDNLAASEGRLRNATIEFVRTLNASDFFKSFNQGAAQAINWITRNIQGLIALGKGIFWAVAAYAAYRSATVLSTLATRLHLAGIVKLTLSKGLFTTATTLATRAMQAFNVAIRLNPLGLVLSALTLIIPLISAFASTTSSASDEQEKLNEELNKTNDLVIKGEYEAFLKRIGVLQKIVTPKGIIFQKVFDPKIIQQFRDELRALDENTLRNFGTFFEDRVVELTDKMNKIPESVRKAAEAGDFEAMLTVGETARELEEYTSALEITQSRLKEIDKVREDVRKKLDAKTGGKKKKARKPEIDTERELVDAIINEREREIATLTLSFTRKKILWEKYGLDVSLLTAKFNSDLAAINKKFDDRAAKALEAKLEKERRAKEKAQREAEQASRDRYRHSEEVATQEYELELSKIDLMKNTEKEKTELRLRAERDRLKKILDLNKTADGQLSKLQIETLKNTIKKLDGEILAAAKSSEGKDLYQALGINLNDEQKDAIAQSVEYVASNISSLLNLRVQAADKAIEKAKEEAEASQSRYDQEIEARNNGYANQVLQAQRELELNRKKEQKALLEKQKALKAQQALDTLSQVSGLITASVQIWKALAGIPIVGPALAATAVGVMFGSYAATKIKAKSLAKEEFGDGGYEFLDGGSHASGNDIPIGTTKSGKQRTAEGGETLAIIKKTSTRKYKSIIPSIVNSLNEGTFEQQFRQSFINDIPIVNANYDSPDLRKMESSLEAIEQQGNRRVYTDSKGRHVEIYKNIKRVHI